MAIGLEVTKTPSHEAIESTDSETPAEFLTPQEHMDREAMEMAKKGQHTIHDDEAKIPGSSIFTK